MEVTAITSPRGQSPRGRISPELIPTCLSPRKSLHRPSSGLNFGQMKYPLLHSIRSPLSPSARGTSGFVEQQTSQSFYDLLGISDDVGLDDIKQAYRQLARKYHPDVCPPEQAEEYTRRFIEVQEAYETLSDPRRKNLYDSHLAMGFVSGASGNKRWDYPQEELMKEEWKSRWEAQLSNLKWRGDLNDGSQSMSWGARMRQKRHSSN
ncbi:hypothetical protein SUGI_1120540 [Cryptomeria japonica]|uniref:chaperone protein dnaJ 20, chloroplastic n=1 Tax=Cryptomeria japonica TaxID=3369 RepID=UPI0024148A03|nr:chaperone protein dnaJ 20, chloroplastic [Cryptomeria japonica]GLJ52647.1 hypothetical protein SUGI_1120540 [Cryptomeria japonica]